VWVLRHAKAAPQGRDDHSRPLTPRGRRQATEVGTYLAGAPVPEVAVPELVLSSSARRAVQTAELVVAELGDDVELVVERRLYPADPDDVVDILRGLGSDPASVLVVGHNPTVHELALLLLDGDDGRGRSRLERGFPTASLAVIAVGATSWTGLSTGTGTLLDLHTPDP
jgi:phosphohistidine phosphatase